MTYVYFGIGNRVFAHVIFTVIYACCLNHFFFVQGFCLILYFAEDVIVELKCPRQQQSPK